MRGAAFTLWIAGPDARALQRVGDALVGELRARHLDVAQLDDRTAGLGLVAGPGRDLAVTFAAGLLARHGVVALVALGPAAGGARAELDRLVEVYVHGDDPAPAGYEPPPRPEVEIVVPESHAGAGVRRTLRTLEVLGLLGREEGAAYSADEEREVIRRLKAFGYL